MQRSCYFNAHYTLHSSKSRAFFKSKTTG